MTTDLEKSLKARLRLIAKETRRDPADLWQNLIIERFLVRLAQSNYRERFVTRELEADSYNRLKRHTQDQIEKLKLDMEDLKLTDTAFEKYSRYGISLLTHMDIYFQMAPLEVKRKMLGSIFPGKLIYQDGKYRTEGMNPALSLILQKTSELQNEKTGNAFISENVSGDVPIPGQL